MSVGDKERIEQLEEEVNALELKITELAAQIVGLRHLASLSETSIRVALQTVEKIQR